MIFRVWIFSGFIGFLGGGVKIH